MNAVLYIRAAISHLSPNELVQVFNFVRLLLNMVTALPPCPTNEIINSTLRKLMKKLKE